MLETGWITTRARRTRRMRWCPPPLNSSFSYAALAPCGQTAHRASLADNGHSDRGHADPARGLLPVQSAHPLIRAGHGIVAPYRHEASAVVTFGRIFTSLFFYSIKIVLHNDWPCPRLSIAFSASYPCPFIVSMPGAQAACPMPGYRWCGAAWCRPVCAKSSTRGTAAAGW